MYTRPWRLECEYTANRYRDHLQEIPPDMQEVVIWQVIELNIADKAFPKNCISKGFLYTWLGIRTCQCIPIISSDCSLPAEDGCPGVSLDTVMIFVAVQLGNLLLTTAIVLIILVAWRRWRNNKQIAVTDIVPREMSSQQHYHSPPSYSDSSGDTLIEPLPTPHDNNDIR